MDTKRAAGGSRMVDDRLTPACREEGKLFMYVCGDCGDCPPCYLVMEEEPKLTLTKCPFNGIDSASWERYYGRQ